MGHATLCHSTPCRGHPRVQPQPRFCRVWCQSEGATPCQGMHSITRQRFPIFGIDDLSQTSSQYRRQQTDAFWHLCFLFAKEQTTVAQQFLQAGCFQTGKGCLGVGLKARVACSSSKQSGLVTHNLLAASCAPQRRLWMGWQLVPSPYCAKPCRLGCAQQLRAPHGPEM